MRSKINYFLCGILIALNISCQKSDTIDGCNDLLREGPLQFLGIVPIDKTTGESLFKLHTDLKKADIRVTDLATNKPYENFEIRSDRGSVGMLVFPAYPQSEGKHSLMIQIGTIGLVRLSYTIVKKEQPKTPCGLPYYMATTDIKIEDQPFTIYEYEGRKFPNILQVGL